LDESELYNYLGKLTREKDKWKESIPFLLSLLDNGSDKIKAKSLWLLGETGLAYPMSIKDGVDNVASFLDSDVPLLRERAINALGRIGRGDFKLIEKHWIKLFCFAEDDESKVRLSFIWASENIATNTPVIYKDYMEVFGKLLHDEDEKVRMEAPEIFRVLGKSCPQYVRPYGAVLKELSETDNNRVVRIHCLGALKKIDRYYE
jgi:HEAT repeat protein